MQVRAKSIDLMPEIQEACAGDLTFKCSSSDKTKKGEVRWNKTFKKRFITKKVFSPKNRR
jgi:hypothetical protein